jgi:hypothetical protein
VATEFDILDKVKVDPLGQAAAADFVLREKGPADTAEIVQNPHVSLYALDMQGRQGVFVGTDPAIDLCLEPFYFMAQYEHASRILTVPFEQMIALARGITINEERLVFIQSTGRAGSTLAGQIFAQLDGVANISEPDALSDLVAALLAGGQDRAEFATLTDATMRLLCRVDAPGGHVLKGRSFVIELGELFVDLYPQSKSIFLYRNANTFLVSSLRAFDDGVQRSEEESLQILAGIRAWLKTVSPQIAQVPDEEPMSAVGIIIRQWLSVMDRYLRLHDTGVEMLAIAYDSWLEAPRETAAAMLDYCAMLPDDLAAVYSALEQDSQAGTVLSRNAVSGRRYWLETADKGEVEQILARHPIIQHAGYVVPNTLGIGGGDRGGR